jgi:2-polyprenyl-6-methoxyphenol hydroxylase-like FAD-dependent oxidoreductase
MDTKTERALDVLVVGAGPTGMLLACALVHHGLHVRIIDAGKGPTLASKAQVLQTRTLEILEQLGFVTRFLERGQPLHLLSMYNQEMKRLFHIIVGELDSRYPFMLSLPQRETEQLLSDRLAELGVSIERQVHLAELRQDAKQVIASVKRAGCDEREEIRAAWLVGCDGAHSAVRGILGLEFSGSTYAQRVLQADVSIDWPLRHADDEMIGFVSEHGPLAAFPLPGQHRYRLLAFDAGLGPSLENFQWLLDTRGPKGARISDPAWMNEYTIHCRMVEEFRVGRVFLAGDAAHTFSPATGQGMNCGMQDAYNLAWKLALCHKEQGSPLLLDSYTAERAPVARALLQVTDAATRGMQDLFTIYNPAAQSLRDAMLRFVTSVGLVQRRVSRNLSMLDVGYRKSPIVGQNHSTRLSTDHEPGDSISLRDWLDFGHGPRPGERAFDGALVDETGQDATRLFQLFSGRQHTLLLFGGLMNSDESYARLAAIEAWALARYPDLMRSYFVQIVPRPGDPPSILRDGPMLFDKDALLHQAYGARGECLYLIRPDGYVGYRGQPADQLKFADYLSRIFI